MLKEPTISGCISSLINSDLKSYSSEGFITKIVGLTIESAGPLASIGDLVEIQTNHSSKQALAEVVGFKDNRVLLFPIDGVEGCKNGDKVTLLNEGFTVPVSENMLGRVVDGIGRPIDDKGPIHSDCKWKLHRAAPNAMKRRRITDPFFTGIKSIDTAMMCGCGQRVGVFAGSGVGKSSVLGMIARNSIADINVIALIGERGKEVLDFIEDSLGEEGMARSILVVSTSDKSPLERVKGAETAMSIAEYFREQGKNVLMMMDSVTRYAMAQREIGLAVGEPPATKGYPPSVFNMLPALLERAGTNDKGSITGFFTVLVEGDDMNDPIADTTRGILDGHIVLSRELASQGHYPAVDVLESVSRVMGAVADPEQVKMAQEMRKLLAAYKKAEDMINIGAYQTGSNPTIDRAIQKREALENLLTQGLYDKFTWEEVCNEMVTAMN